ncbi:hypothetical protein SEPCBS57363_004704 [Sporothrix epigloea]|uniref:Uncharacterized protein n=1 Tax=Sporothrix epigloea TaxID=1892477 RepID=A0ABP0DTH1_9PEZI
MNGVGVGGTQGPGAGAMIGPGGAAASGFPTPAGYTAELSYIHTMVEELSRQLADNKRVLDNVVTGVGRVRNRARTLQLGNEELIEGASEDLQGQEANMDATISMLSEALDNAKHAKEANAALLGQYAQVLAGMLKQFHEYKQKHVADVSAWHHSYRHQLAEARAENSRLRDQIWQMQERAGRANASLRTFRANYDKDPARWDRRVAEKALRQELRFWKRMAMPSVADDDMAYWSDDDDLVDPAEKLRLDELDRKANEDQQRMLQLQQQRLQQQQQQLQYQQQQYEQHLGFADNTAMSSASQLLASSSGDIGDALEALDDGRLDRNEYDDGGIESSTIDSVSLGDAHPAAAALIESDSGAIGSRYETGRPALPGPGGGVSAEEGREEEDGENGEDEVDGDNDETDLDDNADPEEELPTQLPAVPQAPLLVPPPANGSRIDSSPPAERSVQPC